MSAPHQPSGRPRQAAPPGTAEPASPGRRPPPAEPGTDPLIIEDEPPDCEPNPAGDEVAPAEAEQPPPSEVPRLQQPPRGKRIGRKADAPAPPLTGEQRLLLLDTWRRSRLPAGDFAPLVGLSRHTLYAWKQSRPRGRPAWLTSPRAAPTQPPARRHAARHPHAQARQPRLGLRADLRLAAPRPGAAGQPPGRRPRVARGRLTDRGGAHAPAPRQGAPLRADAGHQLAVGFAGGGCAGGWHGSNSARVGRGVEQFRK